MKDEGVTRAVKGKQSERERASESKGKNERRREKIKDEGVPSVLSPPSDPYRGSLPPASAWGAEPKGG